MRAPTSPSVPRAPAVALARRFAAALGLPLFLAALAPACKDPEPDRIRPNRPVPSADHEAACEHGTFCVPPQTAPMDLAAPAPFDRCSVITPLPDTELPHWEKPRKAKLRIKFESTTTTEARKSDPETCCYEWREHCAGRPLRDGPHVYKASPVVGTAGWIDPVAATGPLNPRAASHWLDNALLEHASIAAFSKLALDLLALGAPADLISAAFAAGRDEIEHAQLSFSLAASFTGDPSLAAGPAPFAPAASIEVGLSPARLLRETFHDGCIGEAAAALVLEATARRAVEATARRAPSPLTATLRRMSEDESRHAELAYRIVAWLVASFPEARSALESEVTALRTSLFASCEATTARGSGAPAWPEHPQRNTHSGAPVAGPAGPVALASHGVWTPEEMARARAQAARDIALPLAEALLSAPVPSRSPAAPRLSPSPEAQASPAQTARSPHPPA
ncbi:MAG: hypothetical protein R3B70_27550 [Polyangiaceae bacterium]